MRRLEEQDEEKFWEAWIKGTTLFFKYGKIGSNGHTKLKKLATEEAANAELELMLKAKLAEGFVEIGEDGEPIESGDGDDESGEDESGEDESGEDESGEDESGEDESEDGDGDEDGDEDDDEDEDEDGDEDEDDDEDGDEDGDEGDGDGDEDEDEDNDGDEEEDEPKKPKARTTAYVAPVAAPLLTGPRPLRRAPVGSPKALDLDQAGAALGALLSALGGRSHRVALAARRARRALERVAGVDPRKTTQLKEPFDALVAAVVRDEKRLPLKHALGLLAEVDPGSLGRALATWTAKTPGSLKSAIAFLAAEVDALGPDAGIFLGRLATPDADPARLRRGVQQIKDALATKGSSPEALVAALQPIAKGTYARRVKELLA